MSVSTAANPIDPTKPTIVLVHGAFAESASWDRVIGPLVADGHRVVCAASSPTPPPSATSSARSRGRWCSPPTPTGAP